jgi:predicted NBD/HSP70 family sugar kinase
MQRVNEKRADQVTIRRLNMSAILKLLRQRNTMARADLAKELGLTRNTASNIVSELIDSGLVVETEFRRIGAGRPGLLLELAPKGGFAVGVEIDIDRIYIIILNFKAEVLWSRNIDINADETKDAIIQRTEELVQEGIDWGTKRNLRPLGIGLGIAGLVESDSQTLCFAPTLGWRNIPFGKLWRAKFNLPIYVSNEANTSALAFRVTGDHFQTRNIAYLSIGKGMAAGFILDGHLFRGSDGFAGQAGHIKLVPKGGKPCSCGDSGCWVTEVSLTALFEKMRLAGFEKEINKPMDEEGIYALASLFESPVDELAIIRDEISEMLGIGIANLVNLYNLDQVVLGGAIRPLLPHFIDSIRSYFKKRVLSVPGSKVKIIVSNRDDDSVFGAAYQVLDAILDNPIPLVRPLSI